VLEITAPAGGALHAGNAASADHAAAGRGGPLCGLAGGLLPVIAAELAIAGFEVDVVDRWSDGRPAVLAGSSPRRSPLS
jgi:hypothetical protein